MTREILKFANKSDNNEDLTLLLANVRSRENTLLFFLELFAVFQTRRLNSEQYTVYKQQFLHKQKICTEEIKTIIQKIFNQNMSEKQLRSFWIKLKSILRVSLQRTKTLGLLNERIANLYNQMLIFIEKFYQKNQNISECILIQRLIKRRTLETLIFTKDLYCTGNLTEAEKIRSETFLKNKLNPSQPLSFTPDIPVEISSMISNSKTRENISTRLRKREKARGKLLNQIIGQNKTKQQNLRSLWQLQRNLIGLMEVKMQTLIDKKKTLAENQATLYDLLFSKNIHNHKIITKYSHYCSKLSQMLRNRKTHSKQKFSQSRLNRKISGKVVEAQEIKQKIQRPKTTKQSNSSALKNRLK